MKRKFLIMFGILIVLGVSLQLFGNDCQKARKYIDEAKKLSYSMSDLEKKEALYREAVRVSPSCAEAHNNLGDVCERLGKFEAAVREYKETVRLAPRVSIPYFGLGDIYFKTNRYDEAIYWYEKGLTYEPGDKVTGRRLALLKDLKKGGVIRSQTLIKMLTLTRGSGDAAAISFGEKLIPFDFNKAEIRADAALQLAEIGKALKAVLGSGEATRGVHVVKRKRPAFMIVGHTDIRGNRDYNIRLSLKRATNVVDYLVVNYGIPRHLLKPVGMGENHPLCSSGTEECHAMNRRVEIRRVPGEQ